MSSSIWAIGCWRNEADIARVNVLHHLNEGIDHMLLLDHGSSDGTFDVLQQLSRRYGIVCRQEASIFRQDEILTRLALEAHAAGADWIVPIDADEFWHAPGSSLREVLERSAASALSVGLTNFVQRRDCRFRTVNSLLTMTRSIVDPLPGTYAEDLVEKGDLSFLQYQYPRKHILRASSTAAIGWGNHSVRVQGPVEICDAIEVLHAPLRSVECISRKAVLDREENEILDYLDVAWHVRYWRRQLQAGRLEDEWRKNTYDDNHSVKLRDDDRLKSLVAPWLGHSRLPFSRCGADLPPPPVRVWGISVVRNEADIIETTIGHHLGLGCERILIVDNGSTDETTAVLARLAATDTRVTWHSVPGEFLQDDLVTGLAHQAFAEGATWVLPFDADEFWCIRNRTLAEILHTNHAAVRVSVVNFLQRRTERSRSADLSGLARRPERPVGPADAASELVNTGSVPYILTEYPDKWISRASPCLRVQRGNHAVQGLEGSVTRTDDIVCYHAPLRSRDILDEKRIHGRRLEAQGLPVLTGWHVRRWGSMSDAELDAEWTLNSYDSESAATEAHHGFSLVQESLVRSILPRPRQAELIRPVVSVKALTQEQEASILNAVSSVEGWLTGVEALELARVAVETEAVPACEGRPLIVEVGAYCGKSTVALASAIRAAGINGMIVSIDPHNGLVGAADSIVGLEESRNTARAFSDNLRRLHLEPWVTSVRAPSQSVVWNRRIEMLFLDSLHDEATVASDLDRFEPWLALGGTLAVHDYVGPFPGVPRAVDGLMASGRFAAPRVVESMILLTKLEPGRFSCEAPRQ